MIAVLTDADALVVSAVVTAVAGAGWWQSRRNTRQMRPNAGKTLRDAVDRIEATIHQEVLPRLDRTAVLMANHSDRLAAVEATTIITNAAVAAALTPPRKRTKDAA